MIGSRDRGGDGAARSRLIGQRDGDRHLRVVGGRERR